MPQYAYQPGAKKWKDLFAQSQMTTGRAPTPEEQAALREAELTSIYNTQQGFEQLAISRQQMEGDLALRQKALEQNAQQFGVTSSQDAQRIGLAQQQLSMARRQANKAQSAGNVYGITNMGMKALEGVPKFLETDMGKSMTNTVKGWMGMESPAPTTTGIPTYGVPSWPGESFAATTAGVPTYNVPAYAGEAAPMFGGQSAYEAMGATTPSWMSAGGADWSGMVGMGEAAGGASLGTAGTEASTFALSRITDAFSAEAGAQIGSATMESAMSLATGAGGALTAGGLTFVGGLVTGQSVEESAGMAASTAAGAYIGAQIGSVVPGIGTLIGGIIGGILGSIGGMLGFGGGTKKRRRERERLQGEKQRAIGELNTKQAETTRTLEEQAKPQYAVRQTQALGRAVGSETYMSKPQQAVDYAQIQTQFDQARAQVSKDIDAAISRMYS